jgi:hypothetical protein
MMSEAASALIALVFHLEHSHRQAAAAAGRYSIKTNAVLLVGCSACSEGVERESGSRSAAGEWILLYDEFDSMIMGLFYRGA